MQCTAAILWDGRGKQLMASAELLSRTVSSSQCSSSPQLPSCSPVPPAGVHPRPDLPQSPPQSHRSGPCGPQSCLPAAKESPACQCSCQLSLSVLQMLAICVSSQMSCPACRKQSRAENAVEGLWCGVLAAVQGAGRSSMEHNVDTRQCSLLKACGQMTQPCVQLPACLTWAGRLICVPCSGALRLSDTGWH